MLCATAYSNQTDTRAALEEVMVCIEAQTPSETSHDLAILFVTPHHEDSFGSLGTDIRKRLGLPHLVGTVAESVLAKDREMERQPVLALWTAHLPGVEIQPIRIACERAENGFLLSGIPSPPSPESYDPDSFILIPDPFSTPTQELLGVLEERYPGTTVVGGMASGGHAPGQNTLFLNEETHHSGVVGISLSGAIHLRAVISQGCRPIGKPMRITESRRNSPDSRRSSTNWMKKNGNWPSDPSTSDWS